MRAAFALFLLASLGCRTTKAPVRTETTAALPTSTLVALPRLALDLELHYEGERDGTIKMTMPPDHVMLVPDSTRAVINGRDISMSRPLMWRGVDYVLSDLDAALVRRTLHEARSARTSSAPPPLVITRPRPQTVATERITGLPSRWRPRSDARRVAWKHIIVHHTASPRGAAASIHRLHKANKWSGLGYHFVIGNGTESRDGQVEVGYRWENQIHGAHAKARAGDPKRESNYWNELGIGVCVVGDFRAVRPSGKQLAALVRLVRSLQVAYGIPDENVRPHRSVSATECPGPRFPWNELQTRLRRG
ncbi:MAG: peptidoglycan recognition protein family protein [Planctomycetota bacterium]|nr:peptidoglycan recognition protein family protein [Planctomycetota bacterium]